MEYQTFYNILLALVVFVVVFITIYIFLWINKFVMPICWISSKFFGKYYDSLWAGDGTARYKKAFSCGTLWWGYNKETGSEFLLFSPKKDYFYFHVHNCENFLSFHKFNK
jgi:hypothetical protein